MKLVNNTQKETLSKNFQIASSFTDRSLGLLRKNKGQALLFQTRFGLHTLFMKYSLDILVLDKNLKVVKIKKNLKPNRFFFWNPIHSKVIELSANPHLKANTGDILEYL